MGACACCLLSMERLNTVENRLDLLMLEVLTQLQRYLAPVASKWMVDMVLASRLELLVMMWMFQQCTVQWDNPAAPLVDVSDFGRTQEEGYGNTETKADQTENNYSDTSSAVKITQTYTEDNSDLLSG